MELIQNKLQFCQYGKIIKSTMILESDINISEHKPDVKQLISKRYEIRIDSTKTQNGSVQLKGKMLYVFMYQAAEKENELATMKGEVPFEENIRLEGINNGDAVKLWWTVDDFHLGMINSRKISLKAIVLINLQPENIRQVSISEGCADHKPIEQKRTMIKATQLAIRKKDMFRVRVNLEIPSKKPNLNEILWQNVLIRNCETRLVEQGIQVTGDLLLHVLYQPEEGIPVQWLELGKHFHENIPISQGNEEMIPNIEIQMVEVTVEQKPDEDGEQRILFVDAVFDLDIQIFEDKELYYLEDLYAPSRQFKVQRVSEVIPHLMKKNRIRVKYQEKIKKTILSNHVLQICFVNGDVLLEQVSPASDGITIEGNIRADMICACSDDAQPFVNIEVKLPFQHKIDMNDWTKDCMIRIKESIEQISVTMVGEDEAELKAILLFDLFVMEEKRRELISGVEEVEGSCEGEEQPGIVCYRAKAGETLWEIAKRYDTTISNIKEHNPPLEEPFHAGQRLIIVKSTCINMKKKIQ